MPELIFSETPTPPGSRTLSTKRDEWSGESRDETKYSIISATSTQFPSKNFPTCSLPTTDHDLPNKSGSLKAIPATTSSSLGSYPPSRSRPRETLLDIRRRSRGSECRTVVDDVALINAVKADYRFIYRINDGVGTVNTILQQVCDQRGWREFQEIVPGHSRASSYERAMRSATGWNLWWSYSAYQFSPYKYLRHWQFTNHNPKGFQFCNKLYLTQYLRKMRMVHGSIFDYYPLSYIVPEDYLRLSLEHNKRATESFTMISYANLVDPSVMLKTSSMRPDSAVSASVIISKRLKLPQWNNCAPPPFPSPSEVRFTPVWISKPVAQSQGKGIFLTAELTNIATDKKSVIQEYICRPLLIAGYKWDVRIYVCVAAIDPLCIYVYNEGLCRFCTEKYNTTDLSQTYSHLTNTSLNKLSPTYEEDKELIGHGCKWTLRRLRQYFRDHGICDWYLWQRIMSLVVLTVIGDSLRLGYSASNRNCFDLFGFDVLVDEELKPWLLECNYSPGLGGDSETDEIVKRPMLHQLFDLLGFPDCSSHSRGSTAVEATDKLQLIRDENVDDPGSGTAFPMGSPSGDDVINYDRDRITRHYFELLMDKMKRTHADPDEQKTGSVVDPKGKWSSTMEYSPEARLMDAKTIYSQNLVVQYLKNQCQGKISHKVREQLITLATKKLKNKLTGTKHGVSGNGEKKVASEKRHKSENSPGTARVNTATQYSNDDLLKLEGISAPSASSDSLLSPCLQLDATPAAITTTDSRDVRNIKKPPRSRSAPSSGETAPATTVTFSSNVFGTLKKEFPSPNSEAFQKLKHYFDAGVDYPLDLKTGKFKACPALITEKKDWFNPTTREGGWIRVYPFDARTTKSPYKSSLTDIRQAVRSVETYLKTAEQIFLLHPGESDEFYRKKIKQTCRRETDTWIPPLTYPSSPSNNNYNPLHCDAPNFSPPVIINEDATDYYVSVAVNESCTE